MKKLIFSLLSATIAFAQTTPPPAIDALTSFAAFHEGGTRIVIRGRNLIGPNPVPCPPSCNSTRVTIGPNEARVLSSSDEAIVIETPRMPFGEFDFVLTRVDGQSATIRRFQIVDYLRPYQRVMLPLVIKTEIPGAHGSRWVTEAMARIETEERTVVTQTPGPCALLFCAPATDDPFTTFVPEFSLTQPDGAGAFLYVDDSLDADRVHFNLRIRDVSREREGWGSELPIVREDEFFTAFETLQLLDIPTDARFRRTLRLYDGDGPSDMQLRVEVLPNDGNEVLASHTFLFGAALTGGLHPMFPGYIQLDLDQLIPDDVTASRVRVRVTTDQHWRRFWAFVSVTSNDTQQVTVITP